MAGRSVVPFLVFAGVAGFVMLWYSFSASLLVTPRTTRQPEVAAAPLATSMAPPPKAQATMSMAPPPHTQAPKASARCVVVTELANTGRHQNQFFSIFLPSWLLSTSSEFRGPHVVDLMVFCEPGTCEALASTCFELPTFASAGAEAPPRCYFQRLSNDYVSSAKYSFGLSVNFMSSRTFELAVANYDYIMRSDADAAIMPGITHWIPPGPGAVGNGWLGEPYTHGRLEAVAKKLGLNHSGVHSMQSTFYVRGDRISAFTRLLENLTNYLYENEFTEAICEEVARDGKKCGWSDWYREVSSLYATDITANHVLRDPVFLPEQASHWLDHCSTDCYAYDFGDNGALYASDRTAHTVAQVHLLSNKHTWGKKFLVAGDKAEFCSTANEAWPNLTFPRTEDWDTKDEQVQTFVLRALSSSMPKYCGSP